tara:strand:+ start:295 stop:492 length:198 start_codon:yes stop_codon:yes gene_type:complete
MLKNFLYFSGSGELTGSGGEKLFAENDNKISTDFSTASNGNYLAVLPLSIDATLTVTSGSTISFL